MIEEISAFIFSYTPFDKEFPIRRCEITIYAKNIREAETIAISKNYKFFDQGLTCSIKEVAQGYRQTK